LAHNNDMNVYEYNEDYKFSLQLGKHCTLHLHFASLMICTIVCHNSSLDTNSSLHAGQESKFILSFSYYTRMWKRYRI